MRFLIPALVLVCTVTFLISCQKEAEENLPPVVNAGDSTVSKIIVRDTSITTVGADTAETVTFHYDGSGRLSRLVVVWYNSGVSGPGRFDYEDEYIYQYTGTQTTPARIYLKYTDLQSSTVERDTTYLTYSGGYVSRDSIRKNDGEYEVMNFQKLTTTRYKFSHTRPDFSGGYITDTGFIFSNWTGGNLVQEIDSLWSAVTSMWIVNTTSLTFDAKSNPFKDMAVLYPAPYYPYNDNPHLNALLIPSNNNVLSENFGGGPVHTMNYTYGADGMPRIARTNMALKLQYYYIKL